MYWYSMVVQIVLRCMHSIDLHNGLDLKQECRLLLQGVICNSLWYDMIIYETRTIHITGASFYGIEYYENTRLTGRDL